MRKSPGTHPLLIQPQQLLRDLGRVEGQPQTLDIEFRDDVLQHLLQRQATGCAVSCCGRNGILQDGSTECGQLTGKKSQLIIHLIKSTVYFVAYPCIMSEIWVCSRILLRTRLDSFYHPNENHADMVAAVCTSHDILLYYDLLFRAMASLRLLWKALGTHILNN